MKDPVLFTSDDKRGPLPLVVAITGHRDLRPGDRDVLWNRLDTIFRRLKRRYRSTPIVLLSALAEGADRLAAEVALARGFRLVVPLPMPAAEYRNDFDTEKSKREFDDLLAVAEHVFEVGYAEGMTLERIRASKDDRAVQYAHLGKFLVHYSQILIALWDGYDPEKVGGTAQVVKWYKNPQLLEPAEFDVEKPKPVAGAVCHLVTPHESQPTPLGEPMTWNKGYLQNHPGFAQLNTFNKNAVASLYAGPFVRSRDDLLPFHEFPALPAPLQRTLTFMRDCYATADALALHHQRWNNRCQFWLFGGTLFAAFLFQLFFKNPELVWAKTGHAVFYSGLLALWGYMYWRGFDVKHTIYRALAEGMRVFFFWRLAGLDPVRASRSLSWLHGDIPWVPPALRNWMLIGERESAPPGIGTAPPVIASDARRDLVKKYWLEIQLAYFRKKIDSLEKSQNRLYWLQIAFFGIGIPCLVLWTLANYTSLLPQDLDWLKDAGHFGPVVGQFLNVVNAFFVFFLITLGGIVYRLKNNARDTKILNEFKNMRDIFTAACEALAKGSLQVQASHLHKVGKQALQENGGWVGHYIAPADQHGADDA